MEELLDQWNWDKNGENTPESVPYGGGRTLVWWCCNKGHEWQSETRNRIGGKGCPVCAGRVVKQGDNDLETTHPDLVLLWHPEKNGDLTPKQVTYGTKRKVWWQCDKGHEWQAEIGAITHGGGYPVCSGRQVLPGENDLATINPEIAASWHPEKNDDLTPNMVTSFSNRRVWWQCALGHEWKTAVSQRTLHQNGCPYCTGKIVLPGFNDLGSLFPKVAEQWHPTLNGDLMPNQIRPGSHKRVWWQCSQGHVWNALVYSRTMPKATDCPVCAGKKGQFQERY